MRPRFSLRTILIATTFVAVALSVLISGHRKLRYDIEDNYAQWDVTDRIIDYMEANGGKWPRNWDDLRPNFESLAGRTGWPFELYQSRIFIDFNVDVDKLRTSALSSEHPNFDVVHAKYMWGLVDIGPNQIIHTYFRDSATEISMAQ